MGNHFEKNHSGGSGAITPRKYKRSGDLSSMRKPLSIQLDPEDGGQTQRIMRMTPTFESMAGYFTADKADKDIPIMVQSAIGLAEIKGNEKDEEIEDERIVEIVDKSLETDAASREITTNPQSTVTSDVVERIDVSDPETLPAVKTKFESIAPGSKTTADINHKQQYALEIRKLKDRIQQLQGHAHCSDGGLHHNETSETREVETVGSLQLQHKAESHDLVKERIWTL